MSVRMTALMPVEKQDGPFGAFDGGEFALGLLLGRVAVAAVFVLADDAALALGFHELENLGRGVEAVVRSVDDGRGDGVMRLAMLAVTVNRQRRRAAT